LLQGLRKSSHPRLSLDIVGGKRREHTHPPHAHDDDTFIEEQEEDADVTDIIGGDHENERKDD
jgi:hypothetical protein